MRWVRPLHSILCTFDGELVPFSFAGISTGLHTRGHRFLYLTFVLPNEFVQRRSRRSAFRERSVQAGSYTGSDAPWRFRHG